MDPYTRVWSGKSSRERRLGEVLLEHRLTLARRPGVTAFPDWFAPGTQGYWNGEFDSFFNADTGVDIDALWIDMNEASNFCVWPCTDPEAQAVAMGDPPRPPAIRLGAPRPIAGFPADFQPQCKAEVTFNVNASTFFGENILILGSAITLGAGDISNSVGLGANNYPIWSATIDMPVNTQVTYQYVRAEPDGSYVYESTNRTLTTGPCNSTNQTTHDTITTVSPSTSSKLRRDTTLELFAYGASLEKRQTAGSGDETGKSSIEAQAHLSSLSNNNGLGIVSLASRYSMIILWVQETVRLLA